MSERRQAEHDLEHSAYLNPRKPDESIGLTHFGLAAVATTEGRWQDAISRYRQGLAHDPRNIDALLALGVLLAEHDQRDEAIACWRTVVEINPVHCQAIHNLGVAFAQNGNPEESIRYLRRALELSPGYAEAHFNLANVLNNDERPTSRAESRREAIEHYRSAIRCKPGYIEAYHNLGAVLIDLQRPAEAAVWLRQAARIGEWRGTRDEGQGTGAKETDKRRPEDVASGPHQLTASVLNQLGLALGMQAKYEQAEAAYERAVRLRPEMAEAHSNLGNLYQEPGRLAEALVSYELALIHDPQSAKTRWNRSLSLLQSGDFAQGWREYEWRWQRKQTPPRPFTQPRWDGSAQPGRTLLIYMEQGLGDILQFIRFAASARERVGRIVVECPYFVMPLLRKCAGLDEVVPEGVIPTGAAVTPGAHAPGSLEFDLQIPLMSLPGVLGTTLETIPNQAPYLFVANDRVDRWRHWIYDQPKPADADPAPFNVGIVWQGNPNHRLDRYRSIPLAQFGVLAKIPCVRLISLQKGPAAAQIDELRGKFHVEKPPIMEEMTAEALLDTAALMKNLDLVISADTGTAHLAGGLAVPVWVPLSAIGEWRWLLHREDSPWYPTIRLFRQRKLGRWKPVFRRMVRELKTMAKKSMTET